MTGRPVGLLVWRGRHAWVMSGFRAEGPAAARRQGHGRHRRGPAAPVRRLERLGTQPGARASAVDLGARPPVRSAPISRRRIRLLSGKYVIVMPFEIDPRILRRNNAWGSCGRLLAAAGRRRRPARRRARDRPQDRVDAEERARDLELLREEQARLDELTLPPAPLRAVFAWRAARRRAANDAADDADAAPTRLSQATRPCRCAGAARGPRARPPCGATPPRGSGTR